MLQDSTRTAALFNFFFENERDDYSYLELICARTLGMLRHSDLACMQGGAAKPCKKVSCLHFVGWVNVELR